MSENFDSNRPLGDYSVFNTFYTYSWINNDKFYSLIPYPYREYYYRFIKQYFQWYDGWVAHFHNTSSGMFSTRLAYTILHKLAQQVVGNKLMFNDDGVKDTKTIDYGQHKDLNSLQFIEKWSEANNLDTKTIQAEEWAFAGGDSIIKLDNMDGELIPDILRKDSYYLSTDFKGEICEYTGMIYNYNKMTNQNAEDNKETFYLVEERRYNKSGEPQIRLSMKKMLGGFINNKSTDVTTETIPFSRLPRDISHKFKKDYPNTKLGEWEKLPLKDLGIYLVKASEKVSFLPAMVGGESLLSNCIHTLMMYDYYFSSLGVNLYAAQDKIVAPQHMQTPKNQDPYFGGDAYNGWNSKILTRVPYTNPEDNKPILWQPDTRAEQWLKIRDNLLQTIAMNIGVDDRTISSAIMPNAEKPTAREISSDEHTTTLFVEGKQTLLKNALDKMLDTILDFYGFEEETITIKFNKAGLTNTNNVVTIVTVLKQNGLISDRVALEMVFKDKSDAQIEQILKDIEKAKEKEFKQQQELQTNDVEENIEQQNNQDTSHIKKPEKKGFFRRNK